MSVKVGFLSIEVRKHESEHLTKISRNERELLVSNSQVNLNAGCN